MTNLKTVWNKMSKLPLLRLFLLLVALCPLSAPAQQVIDIWEDVPHHRRVEMTLYTASSNPSGHAVVVCPGGSYFWHDMEVEGIGVAQWLQSQGISAYVLKYRTAGWPAFAWRYRWLVRGHQYPDAQDDLRQALQWLRRHADSLAIDPRRLGAMGFSAGGHLVMSAAELFSPADRPAFVAAIYPVVSLSHSCTHKRSRRALLGERRKRNKAWRDSLSLEQHVPADCPPVFLVNCQDDPVVKFQNSELLDSALTACRVPHVYMQYATGGHGFGASETKGSAESRQWKEEFLKWLNQLSINL